MMLNRTRQLHHRRHWDAPAAKPFQRVDHRLCLGGYCSQRYRLLRQSWFFQPDHDSSAAFSAWLRLETPTNWI